jgi:hypothetical protein
VVATRGTAKTSAPRSAAWRKCCSFYESPALGPPSPLTVKKRRLFLELLRRQCAGLNVGATGGNPGCRNRLSAVLSASGASDGRGQISSQLLQQFFRSHGGGVRWLRPAVCRPMVRHCLFQAVLEQLPAMNPRFAGEVQRVGRGWFVATPNFCCPIEPPTFLVQLPARE